ncbi:MAG TPA: alpha-ribazole phosphatase family protein [Pseudomonadales bacterium]
MTHCVTTLDLLRHGQPEGGEIFRGRTDVPLSDTGWQQMHDALAGESGWQGIVSSPLSRCAGFAARLAADRQLHCRLEPDLQELSFGDWDGMAYADVRERYGEHFNRFWRDPLANPPPNGEPLADFSERVQQALQRLLQDARGQHLLLVTHGGVIRSLLAGLLSDRGEHGLSALMRFEVPYAAFSRLRIYHDEQGDWPQLVFFNRHGQ